jgi:hypothetical protein
MKRGDLYEFHSAPMGTVTTYELESAETLGAGATAQLRNIETDGVASILSHSLRAPENWPSKSYWKRAEE